MNLSTLEKVPLVTVHAVDNRRPMASIVRRTCTQSIVYSLDESICQLFFAGVCLLPLAQLYLAPSVSWTNCNWNWSQWFFGPITRFACLPLVSLPLPSSSRHAAHFLIDWCMYHSSYVCVHLLIYSRSCSL